MSTRKCALPPIAPVARPVATSEDEPTVEDIRRWPTRPTPALHRGDSPPLIDPRLRPTDGETVVEDLSSLARSLKDAPREALPSIEVELGSIEVPCADKPGEIRCEPDLALLTKVMKDPPIVPMPIHERASPPLWTRKEVVLPTHPPRVARFVRPPARGSGRTLVLFGVLSGVLLLCGGALLHRGRATSARVGVASPVTTSSATSPSTDGVPAQAKTTARAVEAATPGAPATPKPFAGRPALVKSTPAPEVASPEETDEMRSAIDVLTASRRETEL